MWVESLLSWKIPKFSNAGGAKEKNVEFPVRCPQYKETFFQQISCTYGWKDVFRGFKTYWYQQPQVDEPKKLVPGNSFHPSYPKNKQSPKNWCARCLTVRNRYQDETFDSDTEAETEAFVKPSETRPRPRKKTKWRPSITEVIWNE